MHVPYIPGIKSPPDLPLGRFLPPIPEGMVRSWCEENLEPGEWVLDPFGFSPLLPIETAQAGFRILVTANNPIHAFLIRVLASAPNRDDMVAALQDLAIASKGTDRMEPYIRGLYQLECASCGRLTEADAFLWKKENEYPYAALVECPFCGAQGEQEIDWDSQNKPAPLPPAHLHQARALNRIAKQNDPLRVQVENALAAYPSRPLIILQTIINKLESLEQTPQRRELLTALILSAADQGNTLWVYPSPRNRPRQIVVPPVFQERNLWKTMEEAVNLWCGVNVHPIPVLDWGSELPDEPCIVLYEGRFKELSPDPEPDFFGTILTAIPRPNQAFWTFSALWTGWIWGQDAIAPIRQVLSRQRYDWNWHTTALRRIFELLNSKATPATKFFTIVAENEPMLLLSSLLAGDSTGFRLIGFSQSQDDTLAQCHWQLRTELPQTVQPAESLGIAREGIEKFLLEKGEPASYQEIHTAAITSLANRDALAIDIFLENENQFASETQKLIENLFQEFGFLNRVGGGSASIETGYWGLASSPEITYPVIDRVEETILNHLIAVKDTTSKKVEAITYQKFPGIYTPTCEEILQCLTSYADVDDPDKHTWHLRPSEYPAAREADLDAMRDALIQIADVLSYDVQGDDPLYWVNPADAQTVYTFHIMTTAMVSRYIHLHRKTDVSETKVILIPGSRANLLAYKRQRDPTLKDRLDREYTITKFRLIRDLSVNPLLSRELFREQIQVDPPEFRASQLALF